MRAVLRLFIATLLGLWGVQTRAVADSYTTFPHLPACERSLAKHVAVSGLDARLEHKELLSSSVIPSLGFATRDMARAVDPAVGDYMNRYGLPGGAVALTYKGKLIFAKSYGYMGIVDAGFAEPDTRFRVASVTKAFTAMAILKLVHDGRLTLDDHPFPFADVGPIIGGGPGQYVFKGALNEQLRGITVNDLLHHAGGWNRDEKGAPDLTGYAVLQPLGAYLSSLHHEQLGAPSCTTLLAYVESQPLQFRPGTRNDYSNIGFCALAEVVRERGGPTYVDYLSDKILAPLGLYDTTMGATPRVKRQDREAQYYSTQNPDAQSLFPPYAVVPAPYSTIGALESLGGAGGIVSTAIDLSRFIGAIAGGNLPFLPGGSKFPGWPKKYYVNSTTLPHYECATDKQAYPASVQCPRHSSQAYQRAHSAYGMGWDDVPGNVVSSPLLAYDNYNLVKTGGFPGTLSSITATGDGYGFAGVFNGDYNNAPAPTDAFFWTKVLPAAYKHDTAQSWSLDFSDQYARSYTSWMFESDFKKYLAQQEKRGFYPSRLEGRFVARLRHHTVDNPHNPTNSGVEYRARLAHLSGKAAPKTELGASCQDVLRDVENASADTPLVSLQRFFAPFAQAYYYQAVWSAPIPQLPPR